MTYVVSNYGSEPPYGFNLQIPDETFSNEAQAIEFMEGLAQLIQDHTASVAQDYRMFKNTETQGQIWPAP